jgi:hypothetical protein
MTDRESFIGGPKVSFGEAFPTIASVRVTVMESGYGVGPGGSTPGNMPVDAGTYTSNASRVATELQERWIQDQRRPARNDRGRRNGENCRQRLQGARGITQRVYGPCTNYLTCTVRVTYKPSR